MTLKKYQQIVELWKRHNSILKIKEWDSRLRNSTIQKAFDYFNIQIKVDTFIEKKNSINPAEYIDRLISHFEQDTTKFFERMNKDKKILKQPIIHLYSKKNDGFFMKSYLLVDKNTEDLLREKIQNIATNPELLAIGYFFTINNTNLKYIHRNKEDLIEEKIFIGLLYSRFHPQLMEKQFFKIRNSLNDNPIEKLFIIEEIKEESFDETIIEDFYLENPFMNPN